MATQAEIASRMIATLAITEPDLDTSVGSVTRKIIDAVAESNAEASIDQHLLAYQYDIDSKTEGDLDDFVMLFGMQRLAPKRATGTVTFYRGVTDAQRPVMIQVNAEIASDTTPVHYVQTVTPVFMSAGLVSIDVPVQAVLAGPQGNLGAGSLTRLRTPVNGILSVSNINPLSGGTAAETDAELRARWKRTVFRSLAGTEPMYEGIALNDDNCSAVNVVGAAQTYREQVQIHEEAPGVFVGHSSVDDVEFIYEDTVVLGPGIDESIILLRDHDYIFDTATRPPRIIMRTSEIDTGSYTDQGEPITEPVRDMVMDLAFEYAPRDSRNLPHQGITNRVDLWVNGVRAREAVQTVVFQINKRFSHLVASPYYFRKFVRENEDHPDLDNVFLPLAFGPIITIPATLSFGGETYIKDKHYWLVHDDTPFGYTYRSNFGLEWDKNKLPLANSTFRVGGGQVTEEINGGTYTFNEVPRDIQQGIDRWRLIGVDAKVHQAKQQRLRFNIAVMYDRRGTSPEIANQAINEAISKYVNTLGFAATVQVSDVLQVIHNAQGVDNVRFLEGADWSAYDRTRPNHFGVGIQRVVSGVVVQSFVDADGRAQDVTFGDSELPVFESIRGDRFDPETGKIPAGTPSVRAQNTFFPRWGNQAGGIPGPGQDETEIPDGVDPDAPPPPFQTQAGANAPASAIPARQVTGTLSGNNVTLSWDDTPSASGYQIFRNSESTQFRGLGPANGTPKSNSISFEVDPNVKTTYYVYVYVGYDPDGTIVSQNRSVPSNPVTLGAGTTAPPTGGSGSIGTAGPPVTPGFNLAAVDTGLGVQLRWDYQAAAEGYQIFRNNQVIAGLGPANGTQPADRYPISGGGVYQVRGYIRQNDMLAEVGMSNTLTISA